MVPPSPTAAQLLEFSPDGDFLREIGRDLYGWAFAHSVRIDKDDNIWAIDKGSGHGHQVQSGWARAVGFRSSQGRPTVRSRGAPTPPLAPRDGLFRQPTDVAWDSQGNIYITDGYVNSRGRSSTRTATG